MSHGLEILFTLTGGFTAALMMGVLTQRIGLSPIVGYLLAGVIIGPFTPGFVAEASAAQQLSELGVILLMFGVGLQFHVEELLSVRKVVVPGAVVQVLVSTAVGVLICKLAGWSLGASIVFGLALSVASTVVSIRMLSDFNALQTPAGHTAVGWLVTEDVLTVLVLVLLPVVGRGGAGGIGGTLLAIGLAFLKVGALVGFTFLIGRKAIPALLRFVTQLRSRELFTLTVLVLALGIAVASAKLFGVSMALGAFLAGMVVGQSEFSARAASEALPMRDAFAVLFFVAMGMLLNPHQLMGNAGLIAGSLAVVMLVTPFAARLAAKTFGAPPQVANTLAVSLAQIGEFSFILAAMGRELGLLPESATQILVAVSIVSITANPFLFRLLSPKGEKSVTDLVGALHQTIVVGYGPVGRTVTGMLRENAIEPTIIEMNATTVESLKAQGLKAIRGDASDPEVLTQAGVLEATGLIFAASGSPGPVIRKAKEMNPKLLVLARTPYVGEVAGLKDAGASTVISAEGEVAMAMVERVMQRLGATADQLDRARGRVRDDLSPED